MNHRADRVAVVVAGIALGACVVALLHPGGGDGRGPYGLQVWKLDFHAR